MKNVVIFSTWAYPKKLCKRMQNLVGPHAKVGYISAGIHDGHPDSLSRFWSRYTFEPMGFEKCIEFPIGIYYDEEKLDELLDCDAIAIGGGNTFELLFMLQLHGLIEPLRKFANSGKVIMGMSAGGIVMCPQIRIAGFADSNYFGLKDLRSLNLVDFEVKPHWDMWKNFRCAFKEYVDKFGVRLIGLSEGQAIWVTDNGVKYYGNMPDFIK